METILVSDLLVLESRGHRGAALASRLVSAGLYSVSIASGADDNRWGSLHSAM